MEKMQAQVEEEAQDTDQQDGDSTAKTGRGVNWRPDILELVDRYARSIDRSRSYVVNDLLASHPKIKRLQRAA